MAIFLWYPSMEDGVWALSEVFFIRTLIPFMSALSSCLSPKALTANIIKLEMRFQHLNCGVHTYSFHSSTCGWLARERYSGKSDSFLWAAFGMVALSSCSEFTLCWIVYNYHHISPLRYHRKECVTMPVLAYKESEPHRGQSCWPTGWATGCLSKFTPHIGFGSDFGETLNFYSLYLMFNKESCKGRNGKFEAACHWHHLTKLIANLPFSLTFGSLGT